MRRGAVLLANQHVGWSGLREAECRIQRSDVDDIDAEITSGGFQVAGSMGVLGSAVIRARVGLNALVRGHNFANYF